MSVGGDSIGGTIVVETPAPEFAAPGQAPLAKGEIGGFYRGNNRRAAAAPRPARRPRPSSSAYTGAWPGPTTTPPAATSRRRRRPTAPATRSRSTRSAPRPTTRATTCWAWRSAARSHLLEAKFGYQDIPYQLYPNQRMDMLGNTQNRASLRYLGEVDWGSLEVRAWREDGRAHHGLRRRQALLVRRPVGRPRPLRAALLPRRTPALRECRCTARTRQRPSARAHHQPGSGALLRVGVDLQRYNLDDWWPASGGMMSPGTFVNVNDGQRDRNAVYGEWDAATIRAGSRSWACATNGCP